MLRRSLPKCAEFWRLVTIGLVFVLTVAGCGGHEKDTAVVRGTVTLDGKPLPGGSVMFTPPSGRGAVGPIASDGTFSLSTYAPGDGAAVGPHKAAILAPAPPSETATPPAWAAKLPQRYQNAESSGLEYTVEANKENVFDIQLNSSMQ